MNFYKTLQTKWLVTLAMMAGALRLQSQAAKVTLQWDASPDTAVVGYRVYTANANTTVLDVSNTTSATIDNLVEGSTYLIYLTAYDVTGVESDPSNQVVYTVPAASVGKPFALQFDGFVHGLANYSPHGSMSDLGEMYPAVARVTLTATAEMGYTCTGWTINSVFVSGNPGSVTMNQHTLVKPVITKLSGVPVADQPPTQISMRIARVAGKPTISIGGELGAWTLEGSSSLSNWSPIASGLTSDQVSLSMNTSNAFYRLRSNPLPAIDLLQ